MLSVAGECMYAVRRLPSGADDIDGGSDLAPCQRVHARVSQTRRQEFACLCKACAASRQIAISSRAASEQCTAEGVERGGKDKL